MSNNTMTSAVPVAEAPKKKTLGCRLLALLPLLLCVAVLILDVNTFTSAWGVTKQSTALKTLSAVFGSTNKAFGILPVLIAGEGFAILGANLLVYGLLVTAVVSVVLSVIALITAKPVLVRLAFAFITWGALIYAVAVYALSALNMDAAVLDIITLGIGGVGLVICFCMKLASIGKAAWLWLIHVVLSLVAAVVALVALTTAEGAALSDTYSLVGIALAGLILVNAIVTFFRKSMGKVRAITQLVCAVLLLVLYFAMSMKADMIFLVVAAAVSAVQLVIAFIATRQPREVAEAVPPAVAEYRKEEYIEAYVYDGGPVAGVELAEEVNPTVASINAANNPDLAAQATVASLLGNGFDPFLITLGEKEKEDFIDLYVLKCKGMMPEIPGYVVGGDNKDFFNKVFIYLGQYREKIPAGLLSKMYQFSMKI